MVERYCNYPIVIVKYKNPITAKFSLFIVNTSVHIRQIINVKELGRLNEQINK